MLRTASSETEDYKETFGSIKSLYEHLNEWIHLLQDLTVPQLMQMTKLKEALWMFWGVKLSRKLQKDASLIKFAKIGYVNAGDDIFCF